MITVYSFSSELFRLYPVVSNNIKLQAHMLNYFLITFICRPESQTSGSSCELGKCFIHDKYVMARP